MGSEYNPSKPPHYDINLSKRTRKPLNLHMEADQSPEKTSSFSPEKENPKKSDSVNEEEEKEKKKKKKKRRRRKHFTEEKQQQQQQLQMVVKQQHDEDLDGSSMKCKRLVSHYARVLSRLIKVKRDPRSGSRKKPVLRLTM
ncbi:hypothetical protein HYC85_010614 [Camellia sinensis]|uniref:Uncharacterized protein n=1 Tax=Camellia sinensis TaxID=4442 RepID=A0A7J7HID6_CAMSI|nr:hypothetical protein HYC85_010614 [Camellia sinensis]